MYVPVYQILFHSPPHFIFLLIVVTLLASAPERFEVCTAVLLKTRFY